MQSIRRLGSAAKAKMRAMQSRAKSELRKAKAKFIAHERKVREQIKRNPEKAVLIAAGVGAALGSVAVALIARRRR